MAAIGKAGRRNAGIEAEGAEAIALSSPLLRAVESMVCMLWTWATLAAIF